MESRVRPLLRPYLSLLILFPDCGEKPEELREMVADVNQTQLALEEVLSDSVYYFDKEKNEIILCE